MEKITFEEMQEQAEIIPKECRLYFFKNKDIDDAVYSFYSLEYAMNLEPLGVMNMFPARFKTGLKIRQITKFARESGIQKKLILDDLIRNIK
jgi:hypothetical protein